MEVFDRVMPGPNQLSKIPAGSVTAEELTTAPEGPKTLAGLSMNVNVGIAYIASWLRGVGAAPLHNMMEDAATAEISRTQLWQWRKVGAVLDTGETVDDALVERVVDAQMEVLKAEVGDNFFEAGKYREAADIFATLTLADELAPFLTLPAYARYFAR
jgi:malate synthase